MHLKTYFFCTRWEMCHMKIGLKLKENGFVTKRASDGIGILRKEFSFAHENQTVIKWRGKIKFEITETISTGSYIFHDCKQLTNWFFCDPEQNAAQFQKVLDTLAFFILSLQNVQKATSFEICSLSDDIQFGTYEMLLLVVLNIRYLTCIMQVCQLLKIPQLLHCEN